MGSRPFRGQRLFGKVGGLQYLLRFADERAPTANAATIGGNVKLAS